MAAFHLEALAMGRPQHDGGGIAGYGPDAATPSRKEDPTSKPNRPVGDGPVLAVDTMRGRYRCFAWHRHRARTCIACLGLDGQGVTVTGAGTVDNPYLMNVGGVV